MLSFEGVLEGVGGHILYKKKQMKACLKMITNFLDIYNGKYYNDVSNNY